MKLYQIDQEYDRIINEYVDAETGEISPEGEVELDRLRSEVEKLYENLALYIKNLEAEVYAIEEEIKNLKTRAAHKSNKIKSLTSYLEKHFHEEKYESPRVVIKWHKSQALHIPDYKTPEYAYINIDFSDIIVREKTSYEWDKKSIKDILNGKIDPLPEELKNFVTQNFYIENRKSLIIK